jgi:hypothetical protein
VIAFLPGQIGEPKQHHTDEERAGRDQAVAQGHSARIFAKVGEEEETDPKADRENPAKAHADKTPGQEADFSRLANGISERLDRMSFGLLPFSDEVGDGRRIRRIDESPGLLT